jgi:hypothetical protein
MKAVWTSQGPAFLRRVILAADYERMHAQKVRQ